MPAALAAQDAVPSTRAASRQEDRFMVFLFFDDAKGMQ